MDVVMATSGIVLKTIASVRVFSINDYDIYINSFINNYNENTICSWENNVPVIQVRFFFRMQSRLHWCELYKEMSFSVIWRILSENLLVLTSGAL